MTERQSSDWLRAEEVDDVLHAAARDDGRIREVLQKARELKGLNMAEVAALLRKGIDAHAFDPAERSLDELKGYDRAFIALHGKFGGGHSGLK